MNTQHLASGIGQPCRIAMPSPAGGATWYVDASGAPLQVTLEQTVGEPGARRPGSQVFLLVGDVPGDYELRFVLKRAWENQVRNSRRVLFQVRGADRRGLSS